MNKKEEAESLFAELEAEERESNPELYGADQAGDVASVADGTKHEPDTEPELEPKPVDPVPEPAAKALEEEEATFKHRFSVMEGKYKAEVPRMAAENAVLREEIERLKYTPQVKVEEKPVKPEPVVNYGDPFREELGNDISEKINSMVQSVINANTKRISSEIAQIREETAGDSKRVFYVELSRAVPDYKQINNSDGFRSFLSKPSGFLGRTVDQDLKDAEKNMDSETVINIFNAYGETVETGGEAEPVVVAEKKSKAAAPVSPKGRVGSVPAKQEEEITQQEINDFHRKKAQGFYKSRPSEEKSIAARIDLAMDKMFG